MRVFGKQYKFIAIASLVIYAALYNAQTAWPQQSPNTARSPQNPSPRRTAEITLNGKKISLDYGSPSMRGRKIMGELVSYDNIWYAGANLATQFTTEADLAIDGTIIPKGTYSLLLLPSQSRWILILNRKTDLWCFNTYTEETEKHELTRMNMKVSTLNTPIEQLTYTFEKAGRSITLSLQWERTQVSVVLTEYVTS